MGSWLPHDHHDHESNKTKASKTRFSRSTAALTWKNLTKLSRNPPFLLFLFLLPAIQIALFCLAFGGNPTGLKVAVHNADGGNWSEAYLEALDSNTVSTRLRSVLRFACQLKTVCSHCIGLFCLSHDLNTRAASLALCPSCTLKQVHQRHVATVAAGEHMVRNGDAWGVLSIREGFSDFFEGVRDGNASMAGPSFTAGDEIVQFRLDETQQQVVYALVSAANNAMDTILRRDLSNFNSTIHDNPLFLLHPAGLVNTSSPIYGSSTQSFTAFVAPGILITIGFAQVSE
jgi:hypothetical protein